MPKITRFLEEQSITAEGLEIKNIIEGVKFIHTGKVKTVIVRLVSGAATSADLQIRYKSLDESLINLVYLFEDAKFPLHIDNDINGFFSLSGAETEGDLHFFIRPDAACVVNIRVILEVSNRLG